MLDIVNQFDSNSYYEDSLYRTSICLVRAWLVPPIAMDAGRHSLSTLALRHFRMSLQINLSLSMARTRYFLCTIKGQKRRMRR